VDAGTWSGMAEALMGEGGEDNHTFEMLELHLQLA
jgi:hypothetical protein